MTNIQQKEQDYNFEIMCYSTDNGVHFGDDIDSFSNVLISNNKLFGNQKLQKNSSNYIKNIDKTIEINISLIKNSQQEICFICFCKFHSNSDNFDSTNKELKDFSDFRKNLVSFLSINAGFNKIFITRDDFSRFALSAAYSKFYTLENLLRSYITKFFNKVYGPHKSFTESIDNIMKEKISKRQNRENIFNNINDLKTEKINTKIFLLDTDDLGDIIYKYSYGNLKMEDLIKKINDTDNLENLKEDIKTNIEKHFITFKEIDFQTKWQKIKEFRNKIAHNSLTDFEETIEIFSIIETLISFLNKEQEKINKETYFDIQNENYNNFDYEKINKFELLRLLKEYNNWCDDKNWEFLSLKNFVYNWLADTNKYDLESIWIIIDELEKDEIIKIDIWKDKNSVYPDQKCIKILQNI